MIDFRYHLVSIVAVFLALAIGIVLGSTELQGTAYNILNHTTAKLQNELDQASSQRDAAQAQAALGEAYAQAEEPAVLRNLLAGQRLLIITEPGAQASVVTGISNAATADAGATITGQIALQQKFFDTTGATLDGLNQINLAMAQAAGITLDPGAPYQQQAAQVIASEILARPSASPATLPAAQRAGSQQLTNAQTMLGAYAQAGFLTTSGQPATQATVAVVVTPQNAPPDGSQDPLDQMLVYLAEELAASSPAIVVAGSSAGSGPGSPIAVLRSNNVSNQVSTVDDADLVSGQTVVIQALAALVIGGKPGSYGFAVNGAAAVAPTPAPAPTASASPSPTSSAAATGKAKK